MRELSRVYRRELDAYFASPIAYLFIGVFLAVTLFAFFWGEAFFARNIADVRPLFEWMPILLIALVAALTMRSWSEERRADTLELLLTSPVHSLTLTGGKFLAALTLVVLALLLTLPLAVTVEYLGPLDWGPVIGGYVASMCLAAAYVAIGLFVSSRTDNQIVSLLVTGIIGGLLYLAGSNWLTALAPQALADVLALVGTGARFDDITRGVIDLRDLYYYLSLVGVFLALNVYSLEMLRWGGDRAGARRHGAWRLAVALIAGNFLVANLWLQPVAQARADITADNRYTLSDTTRGYLAGLTEPLIIRGYFSRDTHPLLAPLVPQMRDLIREYDIAGGERVRTRFIDPQGDPEAARRAQSAFGIQPVSLQTASRYKSSVVDAYFHVVIKYGDEHLVLDYRDLIEIKRGVGADISVALGNAEYQLTRGVRKVAQQYRSGGNVLAGLEQPVTAHAYVSPAKQLPAELTGLRKKLRQTLETMGREAPVTFDVRFQDPASGSGELARSLREEFGFAPMTASLLSDRQFYFYLVIEQGSQRVPVSLLSQSGKADLRPAIETALQRLQGGYLKTVAVYQPSAGPAARGRMMPSGRQPSFRNLLERLRANAAVTRTDLTEGRVPAEADMLLVLAPRTLDEKQRFAIDQFLMRGGTVMVAASPMAVQVSQASGISASQTETGLADWFRRYGVSIESKFVLDPQSGSLVLPMRGPSGVQLQSVEYPYFIDVRAPGLAEVPMLQSLRQVTLAWASPLTIDNGKAGDLTITPLLHSSDQAWASSRTDVLPDYQRHPGNGFPAPDQRGRQTLAVMLEGAFTSAFKGQESPLAAKPDKSGKREDKAADTDSDKSGDKSDDKGPPDMLTGVIEHSPDQTRLIVVGAPGFASDVAMGIVGRSTGSRYTAPARMVQNMVDFAVEDAGLLALRGGTHYTRLLRPVDDRTRALLESANYAAALAGLGLLFVVQRGVAGRRRRWYRDILNHQEEF